MAATADPQLVSVLVLFLALTWLVTGLRVYVRCLVNRSWGKDDSLLLAALVLDLTLLKENQLKPTRLDKLYSLHRLCALGNPTWHRPTCCRYPK
jgi:hypothetical protein